MLTNKSFEKSACIKKYFNNSTKNYSDIGDSNFEWPKIDHGTFNISKFKEN